MKNLNWNMKKWGDVAQGIHTNNLTRIGSGKLMYSVVIMVNNCIICLKVANRVNPKCAQHKKEVLTA